MISLSDLSCLASDAQDGNGAANTELLTACWPIAFQIASRYADGYDDASDICQNAIINLHANLHCYRPPQSFEPWFQRIVVNAAVDYLRRKRVRQTFPPTLEAQDLRPGADIKLLYKRALQAAESLSPSARKVFILRYTRGWSCKEVAKLMELKSCTVSGISKKAKQDVRRILEHRSRHLMR